jgi:hypothetical protein
VTNIGSARRAGAHSRLGPGSNPIDCAAIMASTDPEFEEKAADVIGLYLKPPLNAAT